MTVRVITSTESEDRKTVNVIADSPKGKNKDAAWELVKFLSSPAFANEFGAHYGEQVRKDHGLFVDAFREGRIGGVSAT